MADTPKNKIYCAIYTRKSTSEGLDQDFTSLDNQRESAENYIASQKSEGWVVIPDHYDDGGYTGANADRPALKRLIADIKEDKIDCVIVYKVDRLSRSLLDFVQMLELFEKYKVAFVSVTQAFNTNNSMGRLTLNILLSFAQFEREIISERVKDKMGAARRKGKYLGGVPILGYDLDKLNHKLVINEKEAELVREIFDLYIKEKSLLRSAITLNEKGYKTKQHTSKKGRTSGGIKFKNSNIQIMIKNVLYIGKVKYNGELYPGVHKPIISDEVFNKAHEILVNNRRERENPKNMRCTGLLNHILHCRACNSIMFHTYVRKGNHMYRYYVCLNAQKRGYASCPTKSVNAQTMEEAVIEQIMNIANDDNELAKILESINKDPEKPPISRKELKDALLVTSPIWDVLLFAQKHRALRLLLKEASYDARDDKLNLTLNENGIRFLVLLGGNPSTRPSTSSGLAQGDT